VSELLPLIWERADLEAPVFHGDEVLAYGSEAFARLVALGLVQEIDAATAVVCDACGMGHAEDVVFVDSPVGSDLRAYITCPENGRVAVPIERLRRWSINFHKLALALAAALTSNGADELVPARVWSLGKANLDGRSRELFLARGIGWPDARVVLQQASRLKTATDPVVLIPRGAPPSDVWPGKVPFVVELDDVVGVGSAGLSIDRDALVEPVASTVAGSPNEPAFISRGAIWEVSFGGKTTSVQNRKGARYIARLLETPGREWHCAEVIAVDAGQTFTPPNVSAGDLSDTASVRQYRHRLDALEGEILEAENAGNTEQVLLLKERAGDIEKHLKSVTGLGGVPRRATDDNERARKSVSNAITRARDGIKDHHFTLWQHLLNHVKTANFCVYEPPAGMVSWTVAFADRRPSGARSPR
jgi:hypothetical protein